LPCAGPAAANRRATGPFLERWRHIQVKTDERHNATTSASTRIELSASGNAR
jgi:hypothetical protein